MSKAQKGNKENKKPKADKSQSNRLLKMQLKWALASGWRCLRV